jgi:hypothetical protein
MTVRVSVQAVLKVAAEVMKLLVQHGVTSGTRC